MHCSILNQIILYLACNNNFEDDIIFNNNIIAACPVQNRCVIEKNLQNRVLDMLAYLRALQARVLAC